MASDDPPFLKVGTEVSAKFKGAFCEAKVKRIFKNIKFKVLLKDSPFGTLVVEESHFKGDPIYEVNQTVDVQHSGKCSKAQILHIKDCSTYDVVFDDGDEKRLKRTQMVLKGAKHYNEQHSLDALPLYNPEQFSSPVVAKIIKKNKVDKRDREARGGAGTPKKERIEQPEPISDDEKPTSSSSASISNRGKAASKNDKKLSDTDEEPRRVLKRIGRAKRAAAHAATAALTDQHGGLSPTDDENDENETSDESDDESRSENETNEASPEKTLTKAPKGTVERNEKDKLELKKRMPKFVPGDVVMVFGDAKKLGNCTLAVVVNPKIYKGLKGMKPITGNDIPLRGFMLEGRYFTVSPTMLKSFSGKQLSGFEKEPLKTALSRAKDFLESNGKILPPSWNLKEHILADSTMKKKEKEKEKDREKDATSDSDSEDSEESTDDETDKEFAQARDAFVAHFYKFQEENATPINKQPVLGGKPLDIYRMYRVVHRLGGWKQVCAKSKWRKVLLRMKLEGCPGATSATVKNAYQRYLFSFSQQYTRLGWSLSELTMPAGRRQGRVLIRQAQTAQEKLKARKMSVDDDKKPGDRKEDSQEKELGMPLVEKSASAEPVQQVEKKPIKKVEEEEKEKPSLNKEKEKEEGEKEILKNKVKRERISPSPARSTASSASKDEKEKKKERCESGSGSNQPKELTDGPIKRSDSTAKEFKRERSVAKDLLQRKERKRTDSVSTTSDEESRKRKEKRKSVSSSNGPGGVKERSVEKERGGPSQMHMGHPMDMNSGQIKDDPEEGHVQAHLLCQFRQGQNVRALHLGNWYTARVLTSETPKVEQLVSMLKSKPGETGFSAEAVASLREAIKKSGAFVHYLGWNSRYDEFIPLHKMRVALKDEEEARQKTINSIGDQLPPERINLFLEWSASPEGMDSFKQRNSDEKKSFLQTIGPYRPRRFSITQVEQLSESLHQQKLQKEANERGAVGAPPGGNMGSAPFQQTSPTSGKGTQQGNMSSMTSTSATKTIHSDEPPTSQSNTLDHSRRVRSPTKGTTTVQGSEEQLVLMGTSTSTVKKEVFVKVKMEEPDLARQKEERERREREERLKQEEEKKRKEEEDRRKKQEQEAAEQERKRKAEEEENRQRLELEERMKAEELARKNEEEKKKKEEERKKELERQIDEQSKKREAETLQLRKKQDDELDSMKSSSSIDGSDKNKDEASTKAQRDELTDGDTDTEKLLNDAREVCAARKDEMSEIGSGGGTPSREEADDADKWSVSDNQSVAGGVHLTSPTRGFRGKRKRLNGRQSLPLKKKKDEKEDANENEEEESDDEIEIHKETFAALRKSTVKAMEMDGTIEDYESLELLDTLAYNYNYQPKTLEESRLVADYVRARMDTLHTIYEESKNAILRLNRMVNEARIKQKKAERAEERAAAANSDSTRVKDEQQNENKTAAVSPQ